MIDQVMNKELNYSGLEPRKFVFKPHLMYYLVFIGIAILYMLTLATTITATGDSSEMVVSPYVLGVAHPPGYPLYTMLGNLFTYIPLFNIAYRVNIFSMLFSLLSFVLCFEILKKLIKNDLVSIVTVSFFAVTKLIWEYSIVAEVFALNNFFVFLLFFILIKWEETANNKILYLFFFILGLSLTHHQTVLFLIPAFALFLYQNSVKLRGFNWFIASILFVAGLLPYLFLFIAASRRPPLNWDDPVTIEKFIHMVRRGDYPKPTINFSHFQDMKYGQYSLYLASALRNLTPVGILLGITGIFTGLKYIRKYYWMFLVAYISTSGIFISFMGYTQDHVVINVIQRLYIFSFLVFAVFVAAGIVWIGEKIKANKNIAVFICIPLVFVLAGFNYSKVNKSDNHLLYNFTGNMLKSYPPGAILIVSGDTLSMGIDYHQMVEKHRQDVIVIDQEKMTYPWYCEQKREQEKTLDIPFKMYDGGANPISAFVAANYDHHKIYVTGPRDQSLDKEYIMIGQGLLRVLIKIPGNVDPNKLPAGVIRIEEKKAENDIIWKNFELKDAVIGRYEPNSFEAEIVTIYSKARFNQGWAYDFNRRYDWALHEYEEAVKIDPAFASPYKNLGIVYNGALGRKDKAVEYWEKYLLMVPSDPESKYLEEEVRKYRAGVVAR
ncbi:MAG: hypothetical protein A2452_13165 [Candidatus Firestonebacteria bacterium RIFOXYC2_FULL_39_67]|nr:MAG: hypothetical protein A2536_03200 [Candidatus Firestonebacteria bacterium RIFOXYD2_FULL_39_29]OGF56269.1 MAG: hypothetical protein A2452_13165 [Candidatus Firestonebacteria bacterium RIFOXYC2_FULL_39_67]